MEANYGKPLTDRGLATKLKPYRIKSRPVRIGDVVLKGYTTEDFWDAWTRYLPLCHPLGNKGYEGYKVDNENKNVTPVTLVTGGMAEPDPEADLDDAKVAFEERAATLEHDAGLDRQEAEAAAEEEFPELPSFLRRTQ
jgi:Protein of unknown function (DUF3631)